MAIQHGCQYLGASQYGAGHGNALACPMAGESLAAATGPTGGAAVTIHHYELALLCFRVPA